MSISENSSEVMWEKCLTTNICYEQYLMECMGSLNAGSIQNFDMQMEQLHQNEDMSAFAIKADKWFSVSFGL